LFRSELLLDRLELPPEFAVRHESSSASASSGPPGTARRATRDCPVRHSRPPHVVLPSRARISPLAAARPAQQARTCVRAYRGANPGNIRPGAGPDAGGGHRAGPGADPGRPRPAGRGGTAGTPYGRARPAVHRGRVLPDPAAAAVRRLRVRPAHLLAG